VHDCPMISNIRGTILSTSIICSVMEGLGR
jgi:hypothetical protein